MPRILARTQFGDPILRQRAEKVEPRTIVGDEIQTLIANMRHTLTQKKLGVGIAAPQLGVSTAISVINIKQTKNRPDAIPFTQVIINPEVVKGVGKKEPMWEGCLSFAAANSPVFAQTMRYKKIVVNFYDEKGIHHEGEVLSGLPAHVFQHETDHLNGVLFPERVHDHTTWMNASEYKKRIVAKRRKK